ncbi:AfsR/SARP family transcriptional regulator [Spirillospora sp. CA-294931]|uniref:AfsR/SARP family transcriptional regulator n=1 Tax=Spirillospora sp. CA-294931 TaxID=3240042 RepID=UPI003D8E528A
MRFGVLGPVTAWNDSGQPITLKGPRHRAVLARLIIARRRVVPVTTLVDDLWTDPPPGAVAAVRTFVAALRRALEPQRPPRAPAHLLVTRGPGYALHAESVDAWHFEEAVTSAATLVRLEEALSWWRGPAYADFAEEPWAAAERSRLTELHLRAIERQAETRLSLGLAAEAVPDLDAHVSDHPWREDAWRLLALALYRTGRQNDALTVLRRARTLLVERLGLDPTPELHQLEADILTQAPHLDHKPTDHVWARTTAAYDRTAPSSTRLESTVHLLRHLAVTGASGLQAAREHRLAAVTAAEELGDPDLIARVIGAYDVPAIWTRADDPQQAASIVAAAQRALRPDAHPATQARLLATIAIESRGTNATHAAHQAEQRARSLDDPALLAFALNGAFMQSFHTPGMAPTRDTIGAELVTLSSRNGLVTWEVLGHLIRLQARSALGDFPTADHHASQADHLAKRHELPLVDVFTTWYRALRQAGKTSAPEEEATYHQAASKLTGAMPGLEHGLLPLALLSVRLRHAQPAQTDDLDWGPHEPWTRPLVLLAQNRKNEAKESLHNVPTPPPNHLTEAMWCLTAQAAIALNDQETMNRAHTALKPAAAEQAGAASGLITLGPVAKYLEALKEPK